MTNQIKILSDENDELRFRISELEIERDQLNQKYTTSVAQVRRVQELNENLLRRVEAALLGINTEESNLLPKLLSRVSKLKSEMYKLESRCAITDNALSQIVELLCSHECKEQQWACEAEKIARDALCR